MLKVRAVLMYPDEGTPTGGGAPGAAPKPGDGTPPVGGSGTPGGEGTPPATGGEGTPPAGEGTPPAATPAGGGEGTPPAPADDAARRYSELTARTREAERLAKEATERERLALEALDRLGRPAPQKPAGEQEPVEPTPPEWSGDPAEYQKDMAQYARDLASFSATKAARAAVAEDAAKRARETQAQTQQRRQAEWQTRRAQAIKLLPDYEVIAENPNLKISEVMAGAITVDPEGFYVAHHLGNNLAEADRIAALSPGEQLVEFGMLKAKLAAARQKATVTSAPAPIRPQGSGSSTTTPLAEKPMDEYAAERNKQIAADKGRPGAR